MEAIQELFQFLDINSRVDLKTVALENILGLTGSPDGIQLLTSSKSTIFPLLLKIASDDKSEALRKDASLALINFSANKDAATKMLDMGNDDLEKFIKGLWSLITRSIYPSADPAAMVLCNLTIEKVSCDKIGINSLYEFVPVRTLVFKKYPNSIYHLRLLPIMPLFYGFPFESS